MNSLANTKINTIAGILFLGAGIYALGSYPQKQQLNCQKPGTNVANCQMEIKTWAGWSTNDPDSQQQYVGIERARVNSETISTKEGKSKKLYSVYVVSGYDGKQIKRTAGEDIFIDLEIADRINQFLRSSQTITSIDLTNDYLIANHNQAKIIVGIIFPIVSCGLLTMQKWSRWFK
jgi:hypothetical protein